jgi:hypothetical protein
MCNSKFYIDTYAPVLAELPLFWGVFVPLSDLAVGGYNSFHRYSLRFSKKLGTWEVSFGNSRRLVPVFF